MTITPSSQIGSDAAGRPSVGLQIFDITSAARSHTTYDGHEQVFEFHDDRLGLRAIIAIHDTTLGPALGGCRIREYESTEDALTDVLRLSQAMTCKAALAGLGLGGGKAVILATPETERSEAFFRAVGQAVESLGGRYITGEDSGTSVREMDWIACGTDHVIGTTARGGNPSDMTALGVISGMREAVRHRMNGSGLSGLTVAVQGLGNVGAALCARLAKEGARLVVADIDESRLRAMADRFGASVATPAEIHSVAADVFAPCALGASINDETEPALRCAVVAGSANNQLAHTGNGDVLHRRGILYAPDYVINAGGLISAEQSLRGRDPNGPESRDRVTRIAETLREIFERSDADDIAPAVVADYIAEERLLQARARQRSSTRETA